MPFDPQPHLIGRLLEIRPLRPPDHDDLYAVAADPLIWAQHPDRSRCEPDGFRRFFDEAIASGGALIVIDRETREVIGSSRFHGYVEAAREVEIGWTFLARSRWGGVYNAELKRLMLEHAFRFVDRVVLLVGPENRRSQRAVEKIGGVRAGSRPNAAGVDSIVYEVTAAGFRRFGERPPVAPG